MAKLNLLKTERDFSQFRMSKAYQATLLRIRVNLARNQNFPRFGFIIPKKVLPRVVDRNLIKRRLKSILQKNLSLIKPANVLIFPNAIAVKKTFADLSREVEMILKKAHLWKS